MPPATGSVKRVASGQHWGRDEEDEDEGEVGGTKEVERHRWEEWEETIHQTPPSTD